MVDVAFHPEAENEYAESLAWYDARSPTAALRFELEVERIVNLIKSNPDSFPKYDDRHRYAVLRRFPYSIVYQSQPDIIYIVAVAHSHRKPDYWRKRMP